MYKILNRITDLDKDIFYTAGWRGLGNISGNLKKENIKGVVVKYSFSNKIRQLKFIK